MQMHCKHSALGCKIFLNKVLLHSKTWRSG